jgi:hypothetical protein
VTAYFSEETTRSPKRDFVVHEKELAHEGRPNITRPRRKKFTGFGTSRQILAGDFLGQNKSGERTKLLDFTVPAKVPAKSSKKVRLSSS